MSLGQPFFSKKQCYVGASQPLTGVVQRPYVQDDYSKPDGLWYSVGDDWWRWLQSDWRAKWAGWKEVHVLEFDASRILQLKTVAAVRKFHDEFRAKQFPRHMIDWRKVEKLYAGIEIAPYQGGLRFDHDVSWYYSWDVASGCIWDVSAITRLEHIGTMDPLPPTPDF